MSFPGIQAFDRSWLMTMGSCQPRRENGSDGFCGVFTYSYNGLARAVMSERLLMGASLARSGSGDADLTREAQAPVLSMNQMTSLPRGRSLHSVATSGAARSSPTAIMFFLTSSVLARGEVHPTRRRAHFGWFL